MKYILKFLPLLFIPPLALFAMNKTDSKSLLTKAEKATILEMAKGKRLVFLGEPDHWIKEKGQYQLEVIEQLTSHGFNVVVNERSHEDSKFINEFVQTGVESLLDRCGECGYKGPSWVERDISGILAGTEELKADYRDRMKKNDDFFYKGLRRIYVQTPFEYQGYDVDKIPGILFDSLDPYSKKLSSSNNTNCIEVGELLKRSSTGSIAEEANNLRLLPAALSKCDLGSHFDKSEIADLENLLKQTSESIFFMEIAYSSPSDEELMASYAKREETMFRHLDTLLSNPSNKVIVLGHNAHLPLDHMEYKRLVKHEGNEIEVPGWFSLGSYLNQKYPNESLAIWMLYAGGTHSPMFCKESLPCDIMTEERSIEYKLGQKYVKGLFTTSELEEKFHEPHVWRENGINNITGDLEKAANLIFFVKSVNGI